jgi:adenylate kinase
MALVIVMGLPGAGKSTVLSAVKKTGWKLVNWGDMQFSIAQQAGLVSNRDELRKLAPEQQKKVQQEVGKGLSGMKGNVVLDTHCSISTPKGYLPGLPLSILSKLSVSQLVLITAPISEIMSRRKSDATRIRDSDAESSLREHDDMNRFFLASYAMATGSPARIIINSQGKVEEAQKELLALLA